MFCRWKQPTSFSQVYTLQLYFHFVSMAKSTSSFAHFTGACSPFASPSLVSIYHNPLLLCFLQPYNLFFGTRDVITFCFTHFLHLSFFITSLSLSPSSLPLIFCHLSFLLVRVHSSDYVCKPLFYLPLWYRFL